MKFLISIFILIQPGLNFNFAFGQPDKRTVTGVVTSFEESLPLEGVRISVKGTANNSGTQSDGIYYITVNSTDSVLVFSLAGYQSKEIKISKSNEYNVVLTAGGNEPGFVTGAGSEFPALFLSRCCH